MRRCKFATGEAQVLYRKYLGMADEQKDGQEVKHPMYDKRDEVSTVAHPPLSQSYCFDI